MSLLDQVLASNGNAHHLRTRFQGDQQHPVRPLFFNIALVKRPGGLANGLGEVSELRLDLDQ